MIKLTKDISHLQREWRNHPSIHAWTRQNGILSEGDMYNWYRKLDSDPTIQMFGILSDQGNVGTCGLTSISPTHGSAEFSLLIAPDYQKKGYGRAALKELLKYGFKNLRLHSIWGETLQGNPAFKMFLELGMHDDGVLRERYFKNGEYVDAIAVSILEREARDQVWWS